MRFRPTYFSSWLLSSALCFSPCASWADTPRASADALDDAAAGEVERLLVLEPALRIDRPAQRCRLREPTTETSVIKLDGSTITVRVEQSESPLSFGIEPDTRIAVHELTELDPSGPPIFEVVVYPEPPDMMRFRREVQPRPDCFWLVTLDGAVVQYAFPGEKSEGGIAGGRFPSLDTALAAYGRTREQVTLDAVSEEEGRRHREFLDWRRRMDDWEIACNLEFQEIFRASHPKEFEALSDWIRAADCSRPPEAPPGTARPFPIERTHPERTGASR
jgi:hypothetical protein